MDFHIDHQERYSRGQLLLRTFFGWAYILIPFAIILFIYSFWVFAVSIIGFIYTVFTGKLWKPYYEAWTNLLNMQLRVNSSLMNLVDGYPPLMPSDRWEKVKVDIEYIEDIGRITAIVRFFLGWLLLIPHYIALYIVSIIASLLSFIAFFVILFTGKYPKEMHDFVVGFQRWNTRAAMYLYYLRKPYPPFSVDENEWDKMENNSPANKEVETAEISDASEAVEGEEVEEMEE